MPEKTLNAHILNKHDTDSNWSSSSYIPKNGEIRTTEVFTPRAISKNISCHLIVTAMLEDITTSVSDD